MAVVGNFLKKVDWIHMDAPNEPIPDGWAIADGRTLTNPNNADPATWVQDIVPGANSAYTLPNLLHRMILGADPTKAAGAAAATVGSGNINAAAGAPGPKTSGGENQHQLTTAEHAAHSHGHALTIPNHTHPMGGEIVVAGNSIVRGSGAGDTNGTTATGGSGSPGVTGSISNSGGDTPHENRPLWYSLVPIMRVKN